MGHLGEILLADADFLIDYLAADPALITLVSDTLGPLKILNEALSETDGLEPETCSDHGIEIVEARLEFVKAAGVDMSALSFSDRLTFLEAQERTWTCVTNDRRLWLECRRESVNVRRGLGLLVELVRHKEISTKESRSLANSIAEANPRYIHKGVLADFENALSKL